MADFFFYGTLCHAPLLDTVLGRPARAIPARLEDHAVHWAEGGAFPLIVERQGAQADGLLVQGLTGAEAARLDFYEGGFRYDTRDVPVQAEGRQVTARVYFPQAGRWTPATPWSLADWVARYGAAAVATAGDFMALMGKVPAEQVAARYGAMLTRGAARIRASEPQPATIRRAATPQDVHVAARDTPYAKFFAVEDWQIGWRQFDGSMGAPANRAVFVMADAVTVLPYDPVRDRVLLVEQFRAGPFARGDMASWQLEAIAGRIDPGETPEDSARREAMEEAGLTLADLIPVAQYYPSPGAITEYLYSYVALTDLPDGSTGVFGVEDEAEDIRTHILPFAQMMDLVASGEIANAPLILTALWLQRERPRLRP